MTDNILSLIPNNNNYIILGIITCVLFILYIAYKLSDNDTRGLIPRFLSWLGGIAAIVYQDIEGFIVYLIGKAENQMMTVFDERSFDNAIKIAIKAAVFIAVVSFAGTYRATANYAVNHGFGMASYGIPIAIDLFVILLGYVIYAFSMAGTKQNPLLTIGLFTMAGLSTYINIQHALAEDGSNAGFSITILGAVFPVILALAIELVSMLNRLRLRRSTLIKTESDLQDAIDALKEKRNDIYSEIAQAQEKLAVIIERQTAIAKQPKQSSVPVEDSEKPTREIVRDYHLAGKSAAEITELTGKASSTIYQHLRNIEAELSPVKMNGNGAHK